jgi:hypothetical protein
MPIADTFPHAGHWDAVDLDCAYCTHFVGPQSWPDTARVSRCKLHDVPLTVQLAPTGYKEGEWFCRDFSKAPTSPVGSKAAIAHLEKLKPQLRPRILYGFHGADGNLKEYAMDDLQS